MIFKRFINSLDSAHMSHNPLNSDNSLTNSLYVVINMYMYIQGQGHMSGSNIFPCLLCNHFQETLHNDHQLKTKCHFMAKDRGQG